ncbi:hypothetical protein BJY04DRAFT_220038 [Aspergillus karnatakaensis]|uniref:uncharacterized protein n=1 Tax=Aspergillus karnatakaensis TaxID=1810916 RepID=UPI003CCCA136
MMPTTSFSPQKQRPAPGTNSNTAISRHSAPRQILKKQQISMTEYKFREEWDPETVKDYQVFPADLASSPYTMYQHQHQQHQQHQSSTKIQSGVPNRRPHARSSSLYEEWKAEYLRNPDGSRNSSAATTKEENDKNEWTAPFEAQQAVQGSPEEAAKVQVKSELINAAQRQQPGTNISPVKTGKPITNFEAKNQPADKGFNLQTKGNNAAVAARRRQGEHYMEASVRSRNKSAHAGRDQPSYPSTASSKARGTLREHSDRVANGQARGKLVGERCKQQPEAKTTQAQGLLSQLPNKTVNSVGGSKPTDAGCDQRPQASEGGVVCIATQPLTQIIRNTDAPTTDGNVTINKRDSKKGSVNTGIKQSDRGPHKRFHERVPEPVVYTAPNGTQFTSNDLKRFGLGVTMNGGLKVFFFPCFIEDPWENLRPVLTEPLKFY